MEYTHAFQYMGIYTYLLAKSKQSNKNKVQQTYLANIGNQKLYFLRASTRDPTHDNVMRRDLTGRQIRTSGILKSFPGTHLKDDISLSDACYIRLLPNFCDTGRRPSPISFQTESMQNFNQYVLWMVVSYKIIQDERRVSIQTPLLAFQSACQMRTNAHDCSQHLNHKQHKEPHHTKRLNRHIPLSGVRKPHQRTQHILF